MGRSAGPRLGVGRGPGIGSGCAHRSRDASISSRPSMPARQVSGLAITADEVWVANALSKSITRVDPGSNTVAGQIELEGDPYWFAVSPQSVLVTLSNDASVVLIDQATAAVIATTAGRNPAAGPRLCRRRVLGGERGLPKTFRSSIPPLARCSGRSFLPIREAYGLPKVSSATVRSRASAARLSHASQRTPACTSASPDLTWWIRAPYARRDVESSRGPRESQPRTRTRGRLTQTSSGSSSGSDVESARVRASDPAATTSRCS